MKHPYPANLILMIQTLLDTEETVSETTAVTLKITRRPEGFVVTAYGEDESHGPLLDPRGDLETLTGSGLTIHAALADLDHKARFV